MSPSLAGLLRGEGTAAAIYLVARVPAVDDRSVSIQLRPIRFGLLSSIVVIGGEIYTEDFLSRAFLAQRRGTLT